MTSLKLRSRAGPPGIIFSALLAIAIGAIVAIQERPRGLAGIALVFLILVAGVGWVCLSAAKEPIGLCIEGDQIVVRYFRRRETMELRSAQVLLTPKNKWVWGNAIALVDHEGRRLQLPEMSRSQLATLHRRLVDANPAVRLVRSDKEWWA